MDSDLRLAPQYHNTAQHYWMVAALAVLYYDYVLTFADEVRYFWNTSRMSTFAMLFLVSRYISLVSHVPIAVMALGTPDPLICNRLRQYHQILTGLIMIIVSMLLVIRTYGLCFCNRQILHRLLAILGVVCVVGAVLVITGQAISPMTPGGDVNDTCGFQLGGKSRYFFAAGWSVITVFDSIIFWVTIRQAIYFRSVPTIENSVFTLMAYDGVIYYGIVLFMYITNILSFLIASPQYQGFLTTATNVLSTSLMSRMMINIRHSQRDATLGLSKCSKCQLDALMAV